MNKALFFPLVFMFILTIFASVWGESGLYTTPNGEAGTANVAGEDVIIDMWDYAGLIVVLIAAITIGTISGLNVIGIGLSDTSQKMIFNAILFLGVWACLTIMAKNYLFESILTSLLWIGLTVSFVIGVANVINGTSD